MSTKIACPHCGIELEDIDTPVGQSVECSECHRVFVMQRLADTPQVKIPSDTRVGSEVPKKRPNIHRHRTIGYVNTGIFITILIILFGYNLVSPRFAGSRREATAGGSDSDSIQSKAAGQFPSLLEIDAIMKKHELYIMDDKPIEGILFKRATKAYLFASDVSNLMAGTVVVHTSITPPHEVIGMHTAIEFSVRGDNTVPNKAWIQTNLAMSEVADADFRFDIMTAGKKYGGWILYDKKDWGWMNLTSEKIVAGVNFEAEGKDQVKYIMTVFPVNADKE